MGEKYIVHRPISGDHVNDETCWCEPCVYTEEVFNELTDEEIIKDCEVTLH